MKIFGLLAGILIGVSAFFYFRTHTPVEPSSFSATLPGRDEVCVSGKIHVTLNSFEALRSRFPGLRPTDQVRIGLYAQWLADSENPTPERLENAARCVRATLPPELSPSERAEAEKLLRSVFGITSLPELQKNINDAWGNRPIEWNPSLVQEFRIEIPSGNRNSG